MIKRVKYALMNHLLTVMLKVRCKMSTDDKYEGRLYICMVKAG